MTINRLSFVFFASFLCTASTTRAESPTDWPQWRGKNQNGVATQALPTRWSEDIGVGWKTPIAGLGGSTPVTTGSTAFVTSGADGLNLLMALDTKTGAIKWKQSVGNDMGKKHKKGGGSNPSVVTDGEFVYAFFRSGDFGCFDLEGKKIWDKSISYDVKDGLWWDLGTSPLLTKNAVVLAIMHTGPSYLVAFDKTTGDELWKANRELGAPKEAAQSYATPLNVTVNGKDAIATLGADHLTLHAAIDGKELGRLGGFNPTSDEYFRSISSPVAKGSVIICPYARGGSLTAVDMDALANGKGKDAIIWFRDDLGSDVPTPAIDGDRVYVVGDKSKGKVSCVDLNSGKDIWQIQLPKSRSGYSSSPLIGGDHLYVTQENATTHVIGPLSSDEPKAIATNKLADDEQFTVASPVPSGSALLIRTKHFLYQAVGK